MANYHLSQTVAGLGTIATITVPTTDRYKIDGKINHPSITAGGGQSSIVAVVNVNGSPVYTGAAGAQGFATAPFCTANDVITIVLSSASTNDTSGLNLIKTTIAVSEGV